MSTPRSARRAPHRGPHPRRTVVAAMLTVGYLATIAFVLAVYLRTPSPTTVAAAPAGVATSGSPTTTAAPVSAPASVAVTGSLPPAPVPTPPSAPTPTSAAAPSTRPLAPSGSPRRAVPTTMPNPTPTTGAYRYLDCVRQRESRAGYGVVNASSGAGGAYQFLPATWNATARQAGRYDLVGVHPSQASARDQDVMASYLLSWQGRQHWAGPGC